MSNTLRQVEIFSAGCAVCEGVIEQVRSAACPSCEVRVIEMKSEGARKRADDLGVKSIPAVAVNGKLAECCSTRGVDLDVLRSAGLGQRNG